MSTTVATQEQIAVTLTSQDVAHLVACLTTARGALQYIAGWADLDGPESSSLSTAQRMIVQALDALDG